MNPRACTHTRTHTHTPARDRYIVKYADSEKSQSRIHWIGGIECASALNFSFSADFFFAEIVSLESVP
jgi:hypothetical protein